MTPFEVLSLVISNLDKLGIPYMIGGSFASSAHGIPRSTFDADLVIDLRPDQAKKFEEIFLNGFYVDAGQVSQAIKAKRSFNIIHLESFFKADLFVLGGTRFAREAFSRRQHQALDSNSEALMYVATPEDTVLAKLDWYRQGGEVSENQWRDVIGILKTQAERLDIEYLNKWAPELGVADLLVRVRQEAGL
jgi:hypothetical protein